MVFETIFYVIFGSGKEQPWNKMYQNEEIFYKTFFPSSLMLWRIQKNDTQHNDSQHNDTQHIN
jgi:hypothetical protein